MNLFGLFGKGKTLPFPEFCNLVKQAVRRAEPSISIKPTENGFILTVKKTPVACNLRNLYAEYCKAPAERDRIISHWLATLVTDVPEQTWEEAKNYLRPTLKHNEYITLARRQMQMGKEPDDLPAEPFVGDLSVILVREIGGIVEGVTQRQLQQWGATMEDALRAALNNMGMLNFPLLTNEMKSSGMVVGMVFEDNYLTATWLAVERFRDHLAMRLQGDYVVAVPNRSRLLAVRADDAALTASVIQSIRNYHTLPYWLSGQCYHVNVSSTGGLVTVYQGLRGGGTPMPGSALASGSMGLAGAPPNRPPMVDLSQWGLSEPTEDDTHLPTPWNR